MGQLKTTPLLYNLSLRVSYNILTVPIPILNQTHNYKPNRETKTTIAFCRAANRYGI